MVSTVSVQGLTKRGFAYAVGALFFLLSITFGLSAADEINPVGTSEGQTWSFEKNGALHLKDNWTVYRNNIIAPEAFDANNCSVKNQPNIGNPDIGSGEKISVPDIWGPAFTASVTTGHGTATYCRVIPLGDPIAFHTLRMGTLRSVTKIYALYKSDTGEPKTILLHKNGEFNQDGEQVVANPATPSMVLPFGAEKVTLIIQLSNRIHKQGGIIEIPAVDLKWRQDAADNRAAGLPSALVIILLAIAVGALTLGRRGHDALDHQLFAFLAFAAALRAAFVSDLIWDYFPDFGLPRKYDLEYLSLYLVAIAYYLFVNRLLRPNKRLKIDYLIYGITGSLIVFAIFFAPFFAPGTITLTREPVQILWVLIVIMVVYSVFKTTIHSPDRRREAIVVSLAAIIYAGYEILANFGFITASMEWSQFVIFVAVMVHAHVFVMQARQTEAERDALTERLQEANRNLQNRALALDFALKRAEEASKAKSNFLATFSHELRTPLNAIIGFSELMVRGVYGKLGDKHYTEYANDINSSGTHLLALVDDILDLSSAEAGPTDLENQSVNICMLVKDTMSLLKLQASHKVISMTMNCALNEPLLVADERKIKQVMINLITNAIKFNREYGSITVNIHSDETGLYVDVTDTGIGISEDDIPRVMSRFGQADSSRRTEGAGVGIGLPLSEVLVRQHGGTLKVTSKLGEGTCVALWFPAERVRHKKEFALN